MNSERLLFFSLLKFVYWLDRQQFLKLSFWKGSNFAINNFATLEDQDRWYGRYTVFDCQFHVLGYIALADFGTAAHFVGKFVNDRTQFTAGRSAICPEVNENRRCCSEYFCFEVVFIKFCCHEISP